MELANQPPNQRPKPERAGGLAVLVRLEQVVDHVGQLGRLRVHQREEDELELAPVLGGLNVNVVQQRLDFGAVVLRRFRRQDEPHDAVRGKTGDAHDDQVENERDPTRQSAHVPRPSR